MFCPHSHSLTLSAHFRYLYLPPPPLLLLLSWLLHSPFSSTVFTAILVSFRFVCLLLFSDFPGNTLTLKTRQRRRVKLALSVPLPSTLTLSLSLTLRKSFQYALLAKHLFGASHLICVSIFGNAINN